MRALSPDPIRLLLVEDCHDDHRLLCDLLDAVADVSFAIDWAKDLTSGRDRLENGRFDVCLIDHQLPDGDGLCLLETAAIRGLPAPMILLADRGSADLDRRAMTLGAAGYLDKNRLDPVLLERTIRYAIQYQRLREEFARGMLRDDSTGLITPVLFRDRLARALAFAARRKSLVAVVVVDVACDAGDIDSERREQRLVIQAKRLNHHLRATDTACRLTDQHVALVLEGLGSADDAALATQKVLDRLAAPFACNDDTVIAKPVAGIALFPEDCGDIDTLLRQADAAMRQARTEDGHRYRFGSERVDRQVKRQFLLGNDLRKALDQNALTLRYRPLVHVADTKISLSAEVYASPPDSRHIEAAQFLSIAHDPSLIEAITDWILRAAVAQLLAWRDHGFGKIDLALPFVSKRAADIPILERSIRRHLSSVPIDPGQIEIDLDQDLVISDLASGNRGLAALKTTGVRLALDGFGRNEASLHNIEGDLLDSLKLSSDLYRNLPGKASHETLLKAVISLGHDLDLRVVANGARDEHQFAFLKNAGCDAIKLQTPRSSLSADMFTNWLQKNKRPVISEHPRIVARSQIGSSHGRTSPAAMNVSSNQPLSSLDSR